MTSPDTPTCASCVFYTAFKGEVIGTCAKGGPEPELGCSDVGATESCEKWQHWVVAE